MAAALFNFFKNLASVFQPPVYSQNLPGTRIVPFSNLHIWLQSPELKIGINVIKGQYIYIPPRGNKDYKAGHMIGESLFCLGDKPFGVEPGFLAVLFNENLLKHYKTYITEQSCAKTENTIENLEQLRKYFAEKDEKARAAIHAFALWLQALHKIGKIKEKDDVMLLFKQDYDDPGVTRSTVRPRMVRLAQTNAVKGKYEESDKANSKFSKWAYEIKKFFKLIGYTVYKEIVGERSKENFNAVTECLGNDLTMANGVQCQQQSQVFSRYSDGYLKGMTYCEWEPELEVFQDHLRGDDGYNKYLVKVIDQPDNKVSVQFAQDSKGRYYSDDSIIDLAFNLVFLIVGYDRDAIGSNGQNKGKVKGRYFSLDHSQQFRNLNNEIIKTLKDDFSFDPTTGDDFIKNLSIFYDSPLSERMAGMFFLYRTMDIKTIEDIFKKEERNSIEEAIKAYKAQPGEIGAVFAERIAKIKVNADEQKIQDYIDTYTCLSKAAKNDGDMVATDVFNGYVEKLTQIKKYNIEAKSAMLEIFKARMQLSPAEVDLLDHLEKFTSPTSILSNDGTVILNHLRILPDKKSSWWQKLLGKKVESNRVAWQMEKKSGSILLISSPLSQQKAEKIITALNEYLSDCFDFSGLAGIKIEIVNKKEDQQKQLNLTFSDKYLEKIIQKFAESDIIKYKSNMEPEFHPATHFKIYKQHSALASKPTSKYLLNNVSSFNNKELKIVTSPKKVNEIFVEAEPSCLRNSVNYSPKTENACMDEVPEQKKSTNTPEKRFRDAPMRVNYSLIIIPPEKHVQSETLGKRLSANCKLTDEFESINITQSLSKNTLP